MWLGPQKPLTDHNEVHEEVCCRQCTPHTPGHETNHIWSRIFVSFQCFRCGRVVGCFLCSSPHILDIFGLLGIVGGPLGRIIQQFVLCSPPRFPPCHLPLSVPVGKPSSGTQHNLLKAFFWRIPPSVGPPRLSADGICRHGVA